MKIGCLLRFRPSRTRDYGTAYEIFVLEPYRCCRSHNPREVRKIVDVGAQVGFASLYFAVQYPHAVWMKKDLRQVGWHASPADGAQPVLSGFAEPFDTCASMDQVLCREDWRQGTESPKKAPESPKSVSYFCGARPATDFPPAHDHGFQARRAERVKATAKDQLARQIHALWPSAGREDGFRWDWLVDTKDGAGEVRFDSQYWRANVDPSERYVMSAVNSSRYRLETDGSGFRNLYLTGDWIKTPLNVCCVEAGVMAGMQTARAISGRSAGNQRRE